MRLLSCKYYIFLLNILYYWSIFFYLLLFVFIFKLKLQPLKVLLFFNIKIYICIYDSIYEKLKYVYMYICIYVYMYICIYFVFCILYFVFCILYFYFVIICYYRLAISTGICNHGCSILTKSIYLNIYQSC